MYIKKGMLEEKKSIDSLILNIKDDAIKNRIKQVLDWHIERATYSKYLFYILSIIIIILNSAIPILTKLDQGLLIIIISSSVTIVTGILTLVNFKDGWYRYRETAEKIKTECIKFSSKCSEYTAENDEERQRKLVFNIENILAGERNVWMSTKNDDKNGTTNNVDDNK